MGHTKIIFNENGTNEVIENYILSDEDIAILKAYYEEEKKEAEEE